MYYMPKQGFKAITVSQTVYERFNSAYQTSKDDLTPKGVRSLSSYLSYLLDEALLDSQMASRPARLRKIHVEVGRTVLLDDEVGRVAEVVMQDGEPFCRMCGTDDCIHAGFAHSIYTFF